MKAAIFDMDGTVLDSMMMWHTVIPRLMKEWDLVPDEKFYKDTDFMGLEAMAEYLIGRYSLPVDVKTLQQHWKDTILNIYITEVGPKPYAVEYMKMLKSKGIKLALATLTEHHMADKIMEKLGFTELFDFILTTEDVNGVGKSQPDLYLKCAKLMGASPSECIVFEDSFYPIESAKAAGFPVYVIDEPVMKRHKEKLLKSATRYINSFKELLDEEYELVLQK